MLFFYDCALRLSVPATPLRRLTETPIEPVPSSLRLTTKRGVTFTRPASPGRKGGAKLTIGAIDARPPRAAPPVNLPELDKRIEALKDERANLQGAIDAATARRKFAERFADTLRPESATRARRGRSPNGARPLPRSARKSPAPIPPSATPNASSANSTAKSRGWNPTGRRSRRARLEVRIELAAAAATKATLRVTYAVRNARWMPLYDARLDTGAKDRKPALELVRRAEITQNTGEDWSNVALGVSTVRTARGGSAPDLKSLVVQYPQVPRPMAAGSVSDLQCPGAPPPDRQRQLRASGGKSDEPAMEKAAEQQAVADVSGFQVVFKIPGRVSLGASEGAKSLRISSASIAPDLTVRAVPVLDPTAFLEASFKQTEDAPLLPGRVAIYRDGMFVGRGLMAAAAKDETVRLGFGADDKIKIERTVVKRNEGSAGLIVTTSKTDERSFKTTVRNGHDFPIRIAIEDQLPVSENEDIVVEMLPSTTAPTATNLRDKRGVLEWAFEAKAGEVSDINFAWRIRWPKDKGVVMVPAG